jgi:hypothetical protein
MFSSIQRWLQRPVLIFDIVKLSHGFPFRMAGSHPTQNALEIKRCQKH